MPMHTPDVPTPYSDAPEDAFRNVHRNAGDDYSVTADNIPVKDSLSK